MISTATAFAETPDPKASARALYDRAVIHYRAGDLEQATVEFKASYELYPTPETLFNLAQTYRLLKQYENAIFFYEQYLSTTELPDEDRQLVKKRIAELQALQEKQQSPTPPPTVAPATPVTQSPSRESADRERSNRLKYAGIGSGSAGIALLAAGIGLAVASKQAGDAAYHPSSGVYDPSANDRQNSLRTGDIVCFAVGGTAVIVGAIALGVSRSHAHSPQRAPSISSQSAGL